MIAIPVHDDGDIEPPRESFAVTLLQSPEQLVEFGIGVATATVTIAEGVCDRTVQVRNAVRRSLPCTAVSAEDLAGVRVLSLPRRDVAALRPLDLSGLTGLRTLDLSENGLAELPAGLFAGLTALRQVHLQGNPGAPFRLTLQLARTDAAVTAPRPATVVARVAQGAPFVLRTGVSAVKGGASQSRDIGLTEDAGLSHAREAALGWLGLSWRDSRRNDDIRSWHERPSGIRGSGRLMWRLAVGTTGRFNLAWMCVPLLLAASGKAYPGPPATSDATGTAASAQAREPWLHAKAATLYRVPFLPSARNEPGRQGFLRIINRSVVPGEVRIVAIRRWRAAHAGVRAQRRRACDGAIQRG